MNFQRVTFPGLMPDMSAYAAEVGAWRFLIIKDMGRYTTSYRLINPKGPVSAASTIRGPFDDFSDATDAADDMLADLRRLS